MTSALRLGQDVCLVLKWIAIRLLASVFLVVIWPFFLLTLCLIWAGENRSAEADPNGVNIWNKRERGEGQAS